MRIQLLIIKQKEISCKALKIKHMLGGGILKVLEQERIKVRKASENKTTKRGRKPKNVEVAVETTQEEVKVVEEVKAEEVKAEEVKVEEPVVEEPKAAEEVKKTSKRGPKSTAKKETKEVKETKETKATTKKESKATNANITLQVDGQDDLSMTALIDRVKAAYVAEGHKATSIKNVEVYIKLSENMAYYVIDGYASGISLY
jgi:cell division protein FtsN